MKASPSSMQDKNPETVLTDDQVKFLHALKLLGKDGVYWRQLMNMCKLQRLRVDEISQLLMTPDKLEVINGRIIHPNFVK